MTHNYTLQSLIRFIYRDTSIASYFEIQDAVANDAVLKRKYNGLMRAYRALPKVRFSPSLQATQRILNYSRNAALEAQF